MTPLKNKHYRDECIIGHWKLFSIQLLCMSFCGWHVLSTFHSPVLFITCFLIAIFLHGFPLYSVLHIFDAVVTSEHVSKLAPFSFSYLVKYKLLVKQKLKFSLLLRKNVCINSVSLFNPLTGNRGLTRGGRWYLVPNVKRGCWGKTLWTSAGWPRLPVKGFGMYVSVTCRKIIAKLIAGRQSLHVNFSGY